MVATALIARIEGHAAVVADGMVLVIHPVLLLRGELVPEVCELLRIGRRVGHLSPDVGAVFGGPGRIIARHGDGASEIGVGGVGIGEDLADACLEVFFFQEVQRIGLRPFMIEWRHRPRSRVDIEPETARIPVDALQLVLHSLNLVGGLAGRRCDGRHLVGVGGQMRAQLVQSSTGSVTAGALPGGDHGQLRQTVLDFVGAGSALSQGSRYVLNRLRRPNGRCRQG